MKIYFCGSICGGRADKDLYFTLVKHLKTYGKVLTEHVADKTLLDSEVASMEKDSKHIHDRDLEWLQETDVVVAEVTQPSLGVGYELAHAYVLKKPVLCMFRPDCGRRLSCMIEGAQGENFVVKNYKESEGVKIITDFMARFKDQIQEENGDSQ